MVESDRHPSGPPRLAVCNERHFAIPRPNSGDRVGDVDDKRRAANRGVVGEPRLNAQIFGSIQGGKSGGQDPVRIIFGKPRVFQIVVRRLGMVLQRRLVGHVAHLVRFGDTYDGYVSGCGAF